MRSATSDLQLLGIALQERLWFRRMTRQRGAVDAIPLDEQLRALRNGGGVSGQAAAGYLFHSVQISSTIRNCGQVLDIGCGSGEQLLQVAALNPGTNFIGVDRCPEMLELAARNASRLALPNVGFMRADCRFMSGVESSSVDGVMSTMTLHRFADLADVRRCFAEMSRVLGPGGALYVEDFGRLKSNCSVRYFLNRASQGTRDAFARLYEASMRAAFKPAELRAATRTALPGSVQLHSTFPFPFLVVLKTPSRGLAVLQERLAGRLLAGLDVVRRKDYAQLACAFRFGGLMTPQLDTLAGTNSTAAY